MEAEPGGPLSEGDSTRVMVAAVANIIQSQDNRLPEIMIAQPSNRFEVGAPGAGGVKYLRNKSWPGHLINS